MSETIKLAHPVKVDGVEIDSITIRRPIVKDLIIAARAKNTNEVDQASRLVSILSELSPKTIESLDVADFTKIDAKVESFFS